MKKKLFVPVMLVFVLALAGCGKSELYPQYADAVGQQLKTYQSQNGPIQVPKHPKRVVVLSSYTGELLHFGVHVVGVDSWSKANPAFASKLEDVAEVSDENVEKILSLKPDLIIGLDNTKNVKQLKKIAPVVLYQYGKLNFLDQVVEIGKLVGKKARAQEWVDSFKTRALHDGVKIREKIGNNATVSVMENFDKQLYVFGDSWGRGTEILYQLMGLKMPDKLAADVKKDGYYAISPEVLGDYVGDYLIFSKNAGEAASALEASATYKALPAVKNGHVYKVDAREFYFNDSLTLDNQLAYFEKVFLGE